MSLHFLSLVFWFHSIIQRITHPFVPKCLTKEASSSHPSQSGEVNPFQMAKQITQPVRESPASPQSKLISAISLFCSLPTTCICVCIPTNKQKHKMTVNLNIQNIPSWFCSAPKINVLASETKPGCSWLF